MHLEYFSKFQFNIFFNKNLLGKPEEPIVEDKVRKIGEGAYSVSWTVRSYRPILEHILYYRKTQV